MGDQTVLQLENVNLTLEFSKYDSGNDYVWVPDSIDLKLRHSSDTTPKHFAYTCLEHLFLLLEQIEHKESDWVLFGTGMLPVVVDGEQVTLRANRCIVGTQSQMRDVICGLIGETFGQLRRDGLDTQNVAWEIADCRFAPWTIDPVAVHDKYVK